VHVLSPIAGEVACVAFSSLTAGARRCHFRGDFSGNKTEAESALFHMRRAADFGHLDALVCMRRLCSGGNLHDIFPDVEFPAERNRDLELLYLRRAAKRGHLPSILALADLHDASDAPDAGAKVLECLERAAAITAASAATETPRGGDLEVHHYDVLARMARLLKDGLRGVPRDSQRAGELFTAAADLAQANQKGKLATQLYMAAEEAWADVE
jgi:elongation factor 2 kinase